MTSGCCKCVYCTSPRAETVIQNNADNPIAAPYDNRTDASKYSGATIARSSTIRISKTAPSVMNATSFKSESARW